MFNKILIANRGEISRRIIRTAHRLGIETVAVFSEADRHAPFVSEATEAICIGPPPASDSYLCIEKIIEAAKQTGAEAIHPGYGFLSENADFSDACAKANIVFIGPSGDVIRTMGSKETAKAIMMENGVPVVPGADDHAEANVLKDRAEEIGLPILIKAVAGGGGRGMRLVRDISKFESALTSARREAKAAFGNDAVLLEKYIENPRHIEVQIFGDNKGKVIHAFERDCSVQRRYQKVIEEAPATCINEQQRARLLDAAIRAGKAVNYVGAGTVEFVIDRKGNPYFIEMNTRLQVEHPATEMVTGEDLVEWQLTIASGGGLPDQSSVVCSGHAIELRICAEDPINDFAPSTGQIIALYPPALSPTVRFDSGVEALSVVTPFYDSMIAKLIVNAESRKDAINRAESALNKLHLSGVHTNINFLRAIIRHERFLNNNIDTHFVDNSHDALLTAPQLTQAEQIAAALYLFENPASSSKRNATTESPWDRCFGFRPNLSYSCDITYTHRDETHTIAVEKPTGVKSGIREVIIAEERLTASLCALNNTLFQLTLLNWLSNFTILETDEHLYIYGAARHVIIRKPELAKSSGGDEAGSGKLLSPMPGAVLEVLVTVGQQVTAGTALMLIEAMKIEHTITAPYDGEVTEVRFNAGDQITAEGMQLVVIEQITDDSAAPAKN